MKPLKSEKNVRITMLNMMAGNDIIESMDQHRKWDLGLLDLKDSIWGKSIVELSDGETIRLATLAKERNLKVHCMSTTLFWEDISSVDATYTAKHQSKIKRVIEIASILKPASIRLLAGKSTLDPRPGNMSVFIKNTEPHVFDQYRKGIKSINDAGFHVVVENETDGCILSKPEEVMSFFEILGDDLDVRFIWDIQNFWECGTFPSLSVYETLKPHIGAIHLKGGIKEESSDKLQWASSLEDASWPVLDIVRKIINDKTSPVITLNPPHGARKPGYDYSDVTKRDLDFLRKNFPEIE